MLLRCVVAWMALLAGSLPALAQIELYLADPAVQNAPIGIRNAGASMANFDSLTVGNSVSSISLTPGANAPAGQLTIPTASTTWVAAADIYGGAGGQGNYILARAGVNQVNSFTLTLDGPASYLGFWSSSIDEFNEVRFLRNGEQVAIYQGSLARNFNGLSPGTYNEESGAGHFGNPNAGFLGGNDLEPFAYLSFFALNEESRFDQVVFTQPDGGGFEVDNLVVYGSLLSPGDFNTVGQFVDVLPVPEPLALGWVVAAGGIGAAAVRRRLRRFRQQ